MPDLGAHTFEVTLAYAGALAMIIGLVALSFAQSRRAEKRLNDTERRATDG